MGHWDGIMELLEYFWSGSVQSVIHSYHNNDKTESKDFCDELLVEKISKMDKPSLIAAYEHFDKNIDFDNIFWRAYTSVQQKIYIKRILGAIYSFLLQIGWINSR